MMTPDSDHHSGLREAGAILLFALFVLMLLSLLSYDWRDIPGLHEPTNDPPYNWIGTAGAWGAHSLLLWFGVGAYLLPVWLLVFGLTIIFKGAQHIGAKIGLALLFMMALGTLCELQIGIWRPLCERVNMPAAGGVLLQFITGNVLVPLMGDVGTAILAIALLLVAIVLFLGMEAILAGWVRLRAWIVTAAERRAQPVAEPRMETGTLDPVLEETQPAAPASGLEKKRQRLAKLSELAQEPAEVEQEAEAPRPSARREETPPKRRAAAGEKKDLDSAAERTGASAPASEKAAGSKPASVEGTATKPVAEKPPPKPKPVPAPIPEPVLEPRLAPVATKFLLPQPDLLDPVKPSAERAIRSDSEITAKILIETLKEFGIEAAVENVVSGPVVTRYELLPAPGVRVERIAALGNNIALSLKATSVRVQAPIPGKGLVGVEIPNSTSSIVYLREILEGEAWRADRLELPLALGKDVAGKDMVADLATMPHLLIAGATGSGKTVCMNSILAGLFMARTPEELQMILIDPKIVEFSVYNGMPHLKVPVITNPKKVAIGLQWAIKEMEKRYRLFAKVGVRNIQGFNRRPIEKQPDLFQGANAVSEANAVPERLPYIVIVVDELADLMMTAQAEIESSIARLAQLSRAVGIHMILATQRPSVNVITGTIKANFPSRIAFQVAQQVDSRTILDEKGAEKMLGRGDMLFLPPGSSKLIRAQGALTSDEDIRRIVKFYLDQCPPPLVPAPEETAPEDTGAPPAPGRPRSGGVPPAVGGEDLNLAAMLEGEGAGDEDNDAQMIEASIQIIRETQRASTSMLQRRLRIGYTRAARIMDVLEERGIVGPGRGSDPREILIDLDGEIPDNPVASGEGSEAQEEK